MQWQNYRKPKTVKSLVRCKRPTENRRETCPYKNTDRKDQLDYTSPTRRLRLRQMTKKDDPENRKLKNCFITTSNHSVQSACTSLRSKLDNTFAHIANNGLSGVLQTVVTSFNEKLWSKWGRYRWLTIHRMSLPNIASNPQHFWPQRPLSCDDCFGLPPLLKCPTEK